MSRAAPPQKKPRVVAKQTQGQKSIKLSGVIALIGFLQVITGVSWLIGTVEGCSWHSNARPAGSWHSIELAESVSLSSYADRAHV